MAVTLLTSNAYGVEIILAPLSINLRNKIHDGDNQICTAWKMNYILIFIGCQNLFTGGQIRNFHEPFRFYT